MSVFDFAFAGATLARAAGLLTVTDLARGRSAGVNSVAPGPSRHAVTSHASGGVAPVLGTASARVYYTYHSHFLDGLLANYNHLFASTYHTSVFVTHVFLAPLTLCVFTTSCLSMVIDRVLQACNPPLFEPTCNLQHFTKLYITSQSLVSIHITSFSTGNPQCRRPTRRLTLYMLYIIVQ